MKLLFVLVSVVALAATTSASTAFDCRNGGTPVYNETTRTITQPSNDTIARLFPLAFGAYGYFVLAGGQSRVDPSDSHFVYYKNVTLYDIETGVITSIGSMSKARSYPAYTDGSPAAINEDTGTMIITGGIGANGGTEVVEIYNFFTQKWTQSSVSTFLGYSWTQAFSVNGKFYVLSTTQRTLDVFHGTTGMRIGSISVAYQPARGLQTNQDAVAIGDSIYFTTGAQTVPYMIVYNTTTNTTDLVSVPFDTRYTYGYLLAYGTKLTSVYYPGPDGTQARAFIYDFATNATTNATALIPQFYHESWNIGAIGGTSKGMYYQENAWLTPLYMTQFSVASSSFAPMSDVPIPDRTFPSLGYNAKLGVFAVVDGAFGPQDQTFSNAINLYQESDMTLMTSITINQTVCVCSHGYGGFLCGKATSGSVKALPTLIAAVLVLFVSTLLRPTN